MRRGPGGVLFFRGQRGQRPCLHETLVLAAGTMRNSRGVFLMADWERPVRLWNGLGMGRELSVIGRNLWKCYNMS